MATIHLGTIPFFVLLVIGPFWVHSQGQQALNELFFENRFQDCISKGKTLLAANGQDPDANFFTGASYVALEQYPKAKGFLEQALRYDYQPRIAVLTNLARVYAGLKDTEGALEKIKELAANGFGGTSFLANDEFAYLFTDSRFREIQKKVDENARPCVYGDAFKPLDFWIGDWDVFVNGKKYADSKIHKSINDCILYEDYRTLGGFVGQSTNYYDPVDSLYKQLWIDGRNNITNFIEAKSDAGFLQMRTPDGNTEMTYSYDAKNDEVLQTMASTLDGGSTWNNSFTGLYRKKEVALEVALNSMLREMEDFYRQDRLGDLAQFYTEDAQIFEPGGGIFTGTEEIRSYWDTLKGKGISWKLDLGEASDVGDISLSIVKSTLTYRKNETEVTTMTRALLLWKRTTAGLKIDKDFLQIIE